MKGTQNLFSFIVAASLFGLNVEKSVKDDGKISGLKEIFSIGGAAISHFPVMIEHYTEAFLEAKDLTVQEAYDLILKLKEQKMFADFGNAKVAKWLKLGLDAMKLLADFSNPDNELASEMGNVYAALQSIQMSEKQPIL